MLDEALKVDVRDGRVRDILESSRASNELKFEDLRFISDLYVECLTDHGLVARAFEGSVEGRAYLVHGATVRGGTDADQTSADELLDAGIGVCGPTVWDPAAVLYASQPTSLELRAQHFAQFRSQLVSCLREAQIDVDDDATTDEIMLLIGQAAADHGVDCLNATGYLQDPDIPQNRWEQETR